MSVPRAGVASRSLRSTRLVENEQLRPRLHRRRGGERHYRRDREVDTAGRVLVLLHDPMPTRVVADDGWARDSLSGQSARPGDSLTGCLRGCGSRSCGITWRRC
jgi:hypothetical protein